jgi:multimeric flavodoxin WrbA
MPDNTIAIIILLGSFAVMTMAFNAMNNLFTISECIIVGSSYWNQGIGNAAGTVENDEEGLNTMVTLGKNMAEVLKAIKAK